MGVPREAALGFGHGLADTDVLQSPSAATVAGCVLAFAAVSCAWSSYLARRPPPNVARRVMLGALGAATAAELLLCWVGHLCWWMVPVILLANAWGPLDAVLRYPVVHDIDTVFTVKQVLILCAKLVSFAFGLDDLLSSIELLALLSAVNFVAMPILYLVALPLDRSPEEQLQASKGVDDVDVAVRLARLAADPRRRECLRTLGQAAATRRRNRSQLPL
mmetsp:Transcript_1109/g.2294  ORF Transcript_1109/g.2294 Transcript_1109/m.2294 type:complete len:219 (-) Transcript_1109:25-681(-)